MPAIVKVQVIAARGLPVMDRSSDSTDCFVEIRLGQSLYRTDVCKKTLNPEWESSTWFTFNVNDNELQDEPLIFKVMDYDQYSAHDAIGRVYISLDSRIFDESTSLLEGWFPIYDTLHGIRGEVQIRVMVEIIRDLHRHKQSSGEIMLFSGLVVPEGFTLEAIQGFVEELVVNDDPEYQWIDRIRPPRASNESRQQVFLKLSGELQRKIGKKALEAGGNAIIGYSQSFDLEGESGIVVRGIGTSVSVRPIALLRPLSKSTSYQPQGDNVSVFKTTDRPLEEEGVAPQPPLGVTPLNVSIIQERPPDPSMKVSIPRYRQLSSSESDGTGEAGAHLLGTSAGSGGGVVGSSTSEFNFYSMKLFPSGFIKTIGGIVVAHSVKLLDDINNPDEPETRDAWWLEVRQEVKSHTLSMDCDSVIGYTERTSICDGLCVFSATGTAVVTASHCTVSTAAGAGETTLLESPDGLVARNIDPLLAQSSSDQIHSPTTPTGAAGITTTANIGADPTGGGLDDTLVTEDSLLCSLCHIPYPSSTSPYSINLKPCVVCKLKQVPSILLSTGEIPPELLIRGEGCLVQARVCRPKKRLRNEENASFVSTDLPFLEYSLHGRLLNKLKLKGMNALFGLNIEVTVGDTMTIGVATGTGVYLEALPSPGRTIFQPQEPSSFGRSSEDIQSNLDRLQEQSRTRYGLHKSKGGTVVLSEGGGDDNNSYEGKLSPHPSSPNLDMVDADAYGQDTKPLEVSDQKLKNEDIRDLLYDVPFPEDFHVSSLSSVPGMSNRTISDTSKVMTFVSKQIFDSRGSHDQQLITLMNKALQTMLFRVRNMVPCVVTNLSFEVDLPDDDEVQVTLVAVVSRILTESMESCDYVPSSSATPQQQQSLIQQEHHLPEQFLVFSMDNNTRGLEEESGDSFGFQQQQKRGSTSQTGNSQRSSAALNLKERSSLINKFIMTPRPQIHNTTSSKYLSTINLFLIRETTSIRELGGMSSFLHTFISEAHALARAHVLFLGGNALVNYQLRQCVVMENQHKNQGQCLLNLAGDAAFIQRELEICD